MTHAPRVPYRETIRGSAKVEGRHKKQTGGRGQFGHVWLEIEPNPGARRRVRDEGRRRRRAPAVLPGRREGRPRRRGEGPARGLSGHRLQGDPLRRLVPYGRLGRALVPAGGLAGDAQGHRGVRSRCSSSRSWTSRCACPRPTWARSIATSTRVAGGCWAWTRTDGLQVAAGAGPAGRAVHLRHRAALAHRWPWHVQRDPRPLRGGARARGPEGHRRAPQVRGSRGRTDSLPVQLPAPPWGPFSSRARS